MLMMWLMCAVFGRTENIKCLSGDNRFDSHTGKELPLIALSGRVARVIPNYASRNKLTFANFAVLSFTHRQHG